jgi:hypothetical protein
MRKFLLFSAVLALACTLSACDLLSSKSESSSSTPTSPTPSDPTVNMDAFAGTWSSASASTPATGCGNVKYTVTPVSSTSANVTFAGTCGGNIAVDGSGSGTLSGSSLTWTANGLVSQGGVNCPFSFSKGTATPDSAGANIVVTYTGTVCGIPVSGSETVKK